MKIKNNTLVDSDNKALYLDMEILEPWVIHDFFKICCITEKKIVTLIIDEAFHYWDAKKNIHKHFSKDDFSNINTENLMNVFEDSKLFDSELILREFLFNFKIDLKYKYLFTYIILIHMYRNSELDSKYDLKININKNTVENFSKLLKEHGCIEKLEIVNNG
jgi:hypothetical protein